MNNTFSFDLLNQLDRELNLVKPIDPIQFCSSWFQFKLEQERNQFKQTNQQLNNQLPILNHNHYNFNYSIPNQFYHSTFPSYFYQFPSIPTHPLTLTHSNYPNPYYHFNLQPQSLQPPFNNLQSPQSTNPHPTHHHSSTNFNRNEPANNQFFNQSQSQQQQQNNQQQQQHLLSPSLDYKPISNSSTNPSQYLSNSSKPIITRTNTTPASNQSNHLPSQPPIDIPIDEDSNASNSDEPNHLPMPAGYNFGRRVSVSAESLSPSTRHKGPTPPKIVRPKTISQRKRIEASIKDNLLFRNLDEEQHEDVVNAMEELHVSKGTQVIVQGAVGDFFYVVEQGNFDVYVRGPPTYTYVPPSSNQSQGTLTLGDSAPSATGTPGGIVMTNPFSNSNHSIGTASQSPQDLASSIHRQSTPFGGTTLSHQAPPKKVHSYGPGGSFGELALMYNAPRAATVVATSESATLWALDRVTFRSILIEHTARKRKMYENFLSEVPILVSLSPTEISKIADSLEERSFAEGVAVVKEGEVGREFFIIESGRAEVHKKKRNNPINGVHHPDHQSEHTEEELVGILGKGDHFGELALLHSAPRAATVRAAIGTGRLRVAALGEKAFTRLLGPVIDILSRHAESHYGKTQINHQVIETETNSRNNGHGTLPFDTSSHQHDNLNSPHNTSASLPPNPIDPSFNPSAVLPNSEFGKWNGLSGGLQASDD